MFNFFYIVQIPFMYVLPGNIQYSIPQIGSNRKSQAQYGIPWNPESDANNNCTNPHMSLSHQSNRY